ncbi:lipocalin family protein [Flavobacterium sp.]|uniref:lipocalin family protein n=1 Tax=Flavobacterium sp. TaxID=239 RepID=UPI00261AE2C3|nr:lipocalin family protein [Flavobacterium sp.]
MRKVSLKSRSLVLVMMVAVFGFFTISCSDDDNDGETLAPLTGKWKINQVGTTVAGVETLISAPQNQAGCEKDFMQLKSDNTVEEGNYDSTIDPCALFTDLGIYSRSNNNLTKVIDGVTTTQDIVNLTLSELKLKDANGNIEVYIK